MDRTLSQIDGLSSDMPSNIEIKAILVDRVAARTIAARLSRSGPETIHQTDVFFRCDSARLKLRILAPDRGELIWYDRPDAAAARCSRYLIARTSEPQTLLDILTKTVATVGVVRKMRELYLVGQTRVHIDQVEGLGDFLELETVLEAGQSETEGIEIATELLNHFGISRHQQIAEAYVDLLARQRHSADL